MTYFPQTDIENPFYKHNYNYKAFTMPVLILHSWKKMREEMANTIAKVLIKFWVKIKTGGCEKLIANMLELVFQSYLNDI